MSDTQKLRESIATLKAEAGIDAWYDMSDDLYENGVDGISFIPENDQRYIVAASPAVVSTLLDEIDRLRSALNAAEAQIRADREGLLLCHATRDGVIPPDDQLGRDGLAEYDEVLHTITAALASGNGDAT